MPCAGHDRPRGVLMLIDEGAEDGEIEKQKTKLRVDVVLVIDQKINRKLEMIK